MNNLVKPENTAARGLSAVMAERFQMEPGRFVEAIKQTVIQGAVSDGQLAAFLMVAHQYDLNPLTKEIYAFPAKGGGIQPIVSIDGWMKLINSHPQFDGMAFHDHVDDGGNLTAVTCKIYRKDRTYPTEATEYMAECRRSTEPWQKWPRRMLRHKAAIQCARYAFSFAGVMDEDDFDRMKDVTPERPTVMNRLRGADASEGFSHAHVTEQTAQIIETQESEPDSSTVSDDGAARTDEPPSPESPPPQGDGGSIDPYVDARRNSMGSEPSREKGDPK